MRLVGGRRCTCVQGIPVLNVSSVNWFVKGDAHTSIRDENVQSAVEFLGDVVDDSLGVLEVSDVRLIRTAYRSDQSNQPSTSNLVVKCCLILPLSRWESK